MLLVNRNGKILEKKKDKWLTWEVLKSHRQLLSAAWFKRIVNYHIFLPL